MWLVLQHALDQVADLSLEVEKLTEWLWAERGDIVKLQREVTRLRRIHDGKGHHPPESWIATPAPQETKKQTKKSKRGRK